MTSGEWSAGRGGKMKKIPCDPACSLPEGKSQWREVAPLMSQFTVVQTG